jgi:enamine deaminase RidA (YjgF/YER057c/UK114 family)
VVGDQIHVCALAAYDADGSIVGEGSTFEQADFILSKLQDVLAEAGATMKDVVQTRLYLADIQNSPEAGKAHGKWFGDIRPAMTVIQVGAFYDSAIAVEIEAIAIRT